MTRETETQELLLVIIMGRHGGANHTCICFLIILLLSFWPLSPSILGQPSLGKLPILIFLTNLHGAVEGIFTCLE